MLSGKLTFVRFLGHALCRFKNQLANGHPRSQFDVHRTVVDHLELYRADKACVNRWRGDMDAETEAGEGGVRIRHATVYRTARRLFSGEVYYRPSKLAAE